MEPVSGTGRFLQTEPVKKNATSEPNKVFELHNLTNNLESQNVSKSSDVAQQLGEMNNHQYSKAPVSAPNDIGNIARMVNSQETSASQTYGRGADQQRTSPGSIFSIRA